MARVDNLENFLTDVAGAIKTKKEYSSSQKIAAEDFDTEIASIETGIDTSDATATRDDILYPKTAYVNSEKIIGNIIPDYKTKSIQDYQRTVLTSEIVKSYCDSITINEYTFIASFNGNNVYIDAIKDNQIISHCVYTTTELGITISIQRIALTYDTAQNGLYDLVIGVINRTANTSNKTVYSYFNFVKVLYNSNNNDFNINSNMASTSYSFWNNADSAPIQPLIADRIDRGVFHTLGQQNDWGAHTQYRAFRVAWVNGTGSITTTTGNTRIVDSYDFNYFQSTGNGNFIAWQKGILTLANGRTSVSNKNIGHPAFLSHNLNYMVINGILYKTTPDSSFANIYNSRVQIATGLPSASWIEFSKDDNYMVLASGNYLYVYTFNNSGYNLYQTISRTGVWSIPWNTNYIVSYENSPVALYFYDCTGETYIKSFDRDNKTYMYIEQEEVPTPSKVLHGEQYRGIDGLVTGIMPNNGMLNYTPSTSQQSIPEGYTSGGTVAAVTAAIDNNITQNNIKAGVTILGVTGNLEPDKPDQTKSCTPTTSQQVIEPDNGYELASVTVTAVTSSIDNNIQAGNIKKDVTILGVTGTYEGSSGAKVFETEQAMQADPNPSVGDLAIVKREEFGNINPTSEFSEFKLPKNVTIPVAVSENKYVDFRDDAYISFLNFAISSSEATVSIWENGVSSTYAYTSTNGTDYVLQDYSEDQFVVLASSVHGSSNPDYWDDSVTYFIKAVLPYFGGVFEYNEDIRDDTKIHFVLVSKMNIPSSGDITLDNDPFDNAYYDVEKLNALSDQIAEDLSITNYGDGYVPFYFLDSNGDLCFVTGETTFFENTSLLKNGSNEIIGLASYTYFDFGNKPVKLYKVTNINNKTYTLVDTYTGGKIDGKSYVLIPGVSSIPVGYDPYQRVYRASSMVYNYSNNLTSQYIDANIDLRRYYDGYNYAKTQLTLNDKNQIASGISGYGDKGIITGDGSIYNNLDWNTIWNLYDVLPDTNHRIVSSTSNTTPIISYNHNKNSYDTYLNYEQQYTTSTETMIRSTHGTTAVKLAVNKYLLSLMGKYNIVTINSDKTFSIESINNGLTNSSTISTLDVAYDSVNDYVYCVLLSSNGNVYKIYLQRINLSDNSVSTIIDKTLNSAMYCKARISISKACVYIEGTHGFYKMAFSDGSETVIHSHSTWDNSANYSRKYMTVYNGTSKTAELYDLETDTFTGITNGQSNVGLVTIGTKTYVFTNNSNVVNLIENGTITKTIQLPKPFNNATICSIESCHAIPLSIGNIVPLYEFVIDTSTDNITAPFTLSNKMTMLLYLDNGDIVYADENTVYYRTGINIQSNGSGRYLAFYDGTTDTLIRETEHNDIINNGRLTDGMMKEYTSVTTMNEDILNIQNGEVVKVVSGGITDYYIKNITTTETPLDLSQYQDGDTLSLKGMQMAKNFTLDNELSSGEMLSLSFAKNGSDIFSMNFWGGSRSVSGDVAVGSGLYTITVTNRTSCAISDGDIASINAESIWDSDDLVTISGTGFEDINGSIIQVSTTTEMKRMVIENS